MTDGEQGWVWLTVFFASLGGAVWALWWLLGELVNARDRRGRLEHLAKEIERTVAAFGFGAASREPTTLGGVASEDGRDSVLTAPISGRPCLAYFVAFGYPLVGETVECAVGWPARESIPFMLDGSTHVTLDSRFRFSPADTEHRLDFSVAEARQRATNADEELGWTLDHAQELERGPGNGRLYEWILPPGSHCEIEGEREEIEGGFRSASAVRFKSARIFVGLRGTDEATLDRMRQARIRTNQALREVSIRRRRAIPIAAVLILLLLVGVWVAVAQMSKADARRLGLPTRGDLRQ